MSNQDKLLLKQCFSEDTKKLFTDSKCEFPLDSDVTEILDDLNKELKTTSDEYELYQYKDNIDKLWVLLLEKAIKCLRYYDTREPFINSTGKSPKAYGIKDLKSYYDRYSKFEQVLYGSSRFYRDHVIHVFRTWLIGIHVLTKNNGRYLKQITINEKEFNFTICNAEKISIWTIIALTHDLGYPLEKAKGIIDVTQEMVATFVSNPDISKDFSFHGVQNYMNDFVVRLMSSKMRLKDTIDEKKADEKKADEEKADEKKADDKKADDKKTDNEKSNDKEEYVARLQSKYYFKFQKSLEKNSHGILSTLIIYKLLTYFLESDYNINEDYYFSKEDCRQFYIRREILRAIASHTCDDVYQLYMGSFSFLLRICDDTQEWGRKNISELYVKSGQSYKLTDIGSTFKVDGNGKKSHSCSISEEITFNSDVPDNSIKQLIDRFRRQSIVYVTIFRDGQDTNRRDFSFERILKLKIEDKGISIILKLNVDKDKASEFKVNVQYDTTTSTTNEIYGKSFFDKIKYVQIKSFQLTDKNNNPVSDNEPENWKNLIFSIDLTEND